MRCRTLPPEAIPILEETSERPAVLITQRIERRRMGFRSVIRGFLIGLLIPVAAANIDTLKKDITTIKKSGFFDKKTSPAVSGKDIDPFNDNIPEEIHLIIDECPDITDIQWRNPTLSFLYKDIETQVSIKPMDDRLIFTELSIGCTDIHLAHSIRHTHLVTVLSNASQALHHMERGGFDVLELTSNDGARFEFSTMQDGKQQAYVATIDGLYRITADYPAKETTARVRTLVNTITHDTITDCWDNWKYQRNGKTTITDTFAEHVLKRRQEDMTASQTTMTEFFPGTLTPQSITYWNIQSNPVGGNQIKKERSATHSFFSNGSLSKENDWINQTAKHYDEHGERFFEEQFCTIETVENGKTYTSQNITSCTLYHNGKPIRMYPEEKRLNPALTPEEYLRTLAAALDTNYKMHMFAQRYWEYVHDSPDLQNPLTKGTEENYGQYVQTAAETIQRVEHGKMLGDCDDFADFMKEVARLQQKKAHCIQTTMDSPSGKPGDHVFCSWVKKRKNGRYDGFAIEMRAGLYQNGKPYSHSMENEVGTYSSVATANNAVFRHYPKGKQQHAAPHRITAQRTSNHRMYDHVITSAAFDSEHMYKAEEPIDLSSEHIKRSMLTVSALMGVVLALHCTRKRKDEE